MDTKEISREQISALADGELVDAHVNVALAVLRQPEEQITWDLYHQIGDVLRSDDMAFSLSDGFAARMSARLDAEPAIIAPQLNSGAAEQIIVPAAANGVIGMRTRKHFMRRFVMPGAAVAAAVVAVVFVTAPQQTAIMANTGNGAAVTANATGGVTTVAATSSPQVPGGVQLSSLAQQGEVARDPRIDEYLVAHQRFSPSMYSSAQYARSAGFAIDSDK